MPEKPSPLVIIHFYKLVMNKSSIQQVKLQNIGFNITLDKKKVSNSLAEPQSYHFY